MKFSIQYLSFFVIQTEGAGDPDSGRRYKHYQTLDQFDYEESEIKSFLDSEFARIAKRKADVHAVSENAPTKIGRFVVEPGHDPDSNPNYNLFQKLRSARDKQQFHYACDDMVRLYMNTSAVRGGAFIVAQGKLNELFDDPFVFVLKCDFESKIARVSDEKSLISHVEMAISARNIKSIQYPNMPEEGMLEPFELKIHQASHARYFEDFLKYVSYEKSKPEIVTDQVLDLVQQYMETKWQGGEGEEDAMPPYAAPYVAASAETAADDGAYERAREPEAGGEPAAESPLRLAEDGGAEAEDRRRDGAGNADGGGPDYSPDYGAHAGEPGGAGAGAQGHPGRQREASQYEAWAASDKRQLQEKWTHDDVMEATAQIVELQPELELKFKLDDISVKGRMSDYGGSLHIARFRGRYVVLIEGDTFEFEKGLSPVELLYPDELEDVLARVARRNEEA
ncbi:DUF3900 domain-containing protein [Cohnella algarum]|nr:DUF3900 domain-containing protein [Cohnella algarum]